MSELGVIVVILAILIPLWRLLRRDFVAGLAYAVFFWVSMTTMLRVEIQGFPAFTIHRLMLMTAAIVWLSRNRLSVAARVPLIACFIFWALANLVSLVGTEIDFLASLKRFLDSVLEVFVSYVILSSSLKTREDALRVLRAAWLGLLVVAALAVIERFTHFNPVDRFIPGYVRDPAMFQDILSTYQHRILLGTAMAMGMPLTFLLWSAQVIRISTFWCATILLCSASYFSFSRGPWLALALAFVIMTLMGSVWIKRKVFLIGLLALLALVARPGVVTTITGLAEASVDANSFKGGNVQFRLELWTVAYSQIAGSPWSFLFGCGPGIGEGRSLAWNFSYQTKLRAVESWDNEYAYILYQSGIIGLVASLLLYFTAFRKIFAGWRLATLPDRDVLACLLAAVIIPIWMMSNVLIFAKQLDYLFWALVAASLVIAQHESVEDLVFVEEPVAASDVELNRSGSQDTVTS